MFAMSAPSNRHLTTGWKALLVPLDRLQLVRTHDLAIAQLKTDSLEGNIL